MATTSQSSAMNPSDYVTQHLQHFETQRQQMGLTASGHSHADFPNPYALLLPIALFVVLTSFAAFHERWAVFRLAVPMRLPQRVLVWWSCAWRQWLVSLLFGFAGGIAFTQLSSKLGMPMTQLAADISHGSGRYANLLATGVAMVPLVAAPLVCALLSVPVTGYVIRRGLAARSLAVPDILTVWQAILLGATTLVWTGIGALIIANLSVPLQKDVAGVVDLLFSAVWGMYIVLPRQVRRAKRMVGDVEDA
jgi:hypothetical protein